MNLSDPPHHRDFHTPCEGCGAHWREDSRGWEMNHATDCPYLEGVEYGGFREVRGKA